VTRDLLNRSQRISVAVTLCALEMTLRQALAEQANEEGILYRRNGMLPSEQQAQIHELIQAALVEIALLAKELDLPVEVQNSRNDLWGKLAIQWADLQDIRPEKLVRYGEVAPELEVVLTPPLQRLGNVITRLRNALESETHRH
jgi:hypothetical protein